METKERSILHLDMDAFYAAIEQRDRPELKGKPVIVGADPKGGKGRGVVSTASYEARVFGIRSALPISTAYRLCPGGVFLGVDMEKYLKVSKEVMEILARVTDVIEPVSIDEAFLDVTRSRRARGSAEEIARELKASIRAELQLTASVGAATSKLVAKIASDLRKPDGLVVVAPGDEAAFLFPLPIRRLWGVGPKTEESFEKLGIRTIGDLQKLSKETLERRLGTHGEDLLKLSRGIDPRPVHTSSEAKSLGQEHTYETDTRDLAVLRKTLLGLADAVSSRLRSHGVKARTVALKYRDEDFKTSTRQETLEEPTDSGDALFKVAFGLMRTVHGRKRVRLLGIYASSLDRPGQLDLFPEVVRPQTSVDRLRDLVEGQFGEGALVRASLLRGGRSPKP